MTKLPNNVKSSIFVFLKKQRNFAKKFKIFFYGSKFKNMRYSELLLDLRKSRKIDISINFYYLNLKKKVGLFLYKFLQYMELFYIKKIYIYMLKFNILFFFFKKVKGFFLSNISYLFLFKRKHMFWRILKRIFKVIRFLNKNSNKYCHFLAVEEKHDFFILEYAYSLYRHNFLIFRKLYFFFNSLLKKKKYIIRRRRRTRLQIAEDNLIKERKLAEYKKLLRNPLKLKPGMILDGGFMNKNERPSVENKHKIYVDKKYLYDKNLSKLFILQIQVKILKKILEYKALLLSNLIVVIKFLMKKKRKTNGKFFSKYFKKLVNHYAFFSVNFLKTVYFLTKEKHPYISSYLRFDLSLYKRLKNLEINTLSMFFFSSFEKIMYYNIKVTLGLYNFFFKYSFKSSYPFLCKHNLKKINAKFIKVFEYKSGLLYNLEKNLNSITVSDLYTILKRKKNFDKKVIFFPFLKFFFKLKYNFGLFWFDFLNVYNILIVLNFLLESNTINTWNFNNLKCLVDFIFFVNDTKFSWSLIAKKNIFFKVKLNLYEVSSVKLNYSFLLKELLLFFNFCFLKKWRWLNLLKNCENLYLQNQDLKKKKDILMILKGTLYKDHNFSEFLLKIKNFFFGIGVFKIFFWFLKDCLCNKQILREHFSLYQNLINISQLSLDKFMSGLSNNLTLLSSQYNLDFTYRRYLYDFLIILHGKKKQKMYALFFFKMIFSYLNLYFRSNFFSLTMVFLLSLPFLTFKYSFFYYIIKNNTLVSYLPRYHWLRFFFYNNFLKLGDKKLLINYNVNLLSFSLFDIFNYYDYILNRLSLYVTSRNSLNEITYILKKSCFLTMRLKLKYYNKFLTYKLFNDLFSFNYLVLKKTSLKKYMTYKY